MFTKYKTAFAGYITMLVITTVMPLMFNAEQLQALVIFPIILISAYLTGVGSDEMGLKPGTLKEYGIAVSYPLIICIFIILIAAFTGNLGEISYNAEIPGKTALLFFMTLILAFATEEGFFRGWLFGMLEREKINPRTIILFTAAAFSLWHFPLFFLDKGFAKNMGMVPLYLGGAFLGGMILGLFRYRSGSIVVSALSHALWNTTAYTLFGAGDRTGILGIKMTNIFDPERGVMGMALSIVFLGILWHRTFKSKPGRRHLHP